VYCRDCGQQVPEGAKYCPSCGADQGATGHHPKGIATPWIILALLLFPPLGLLLMFTSSRWSDNTKWIVAGFFFAPLWARFLWQRRWSPIVKLGLLAAFMAAGFVTVLAFRGLNAAVWIFILTIVTLFFIIRSKGAQPRAEGGTATGQTSLRGVVQSKLDSCHDVIAQIEEHTVFDFFPMTSPERRQYLAALEVRSEAMDLYEHAGTGPDLVAADARATEALNELKSAQDSLWTTRDEGDTFPQP
jgi:hypothetical protein